MPRDYYQACSLIHPGLAPSILPGVLFLGECLKYWRTGGTPQSAGILKGLSNWTEPWRPSGPERLQGTAEAAQGSCGFGCSSRDLPWPGPCLPGSPSLPLLPSISLLPRPGYTLFCTGQRLGYIHSWQSLRLLPSPLQMLPLLWLYVSYNSSRSWALTSQLTVLLQRTLIIPLVPIPGLSTLIVSFLVKLAFEAFTFGRWLYPRPYRA